MMQSTRDRLAVELTAVIDEWISDQSDYHDWPHFVPDLAAIMANAALLVLTHLSIMEQALESEGRIKDED